MIHHLLKDVSVAFAYLKVNSSDVADLHKSLLKV